MISGHTMYRYLTGSILKKIGFEDISLEDVEVEEEELKAKQRQEEQERKRNEAQNKAGDEEKEVQDMEKEVEQKNKESMLGWSMRQVGLGGEEKGKRDQNTGSAANTGTAGGSFLSGTAPL